MNRPFSLPSLIIVLILHAGLIVLAVIALPSQLNSPPNQTSIAVQLLPVQEREMPAQPAPASPVPASPPAAAPPERKPAEPKPVPKIKPKAVPKPRTAREPASSDVKAPARPSATAIQSAEPVQSAPPLAAAAPQAPVASVPPTKTGVYISAEYAATNPEPPYPMMSKRYGEQGTVVLRVFVKADGTAGKIEISASSGYPLLDESARTTIQRWRFRPATIDGKPVDEWYLLRNTFKLQN